LNALGALARWDATASVGGNADEPLSTAIARAQRLIAAGNRICLLSDGWCTDANATAALARLKRHAEMRVVIVVDPLERELAPKGAYVFETAADRRVVELAGAEARTGFRDELAKGWHGLAEACDAAGVAWTTLSTGDEPDVALAPFLRRRGARHE
jgi:hypothetical protein